MTDAVFAALCHPAGDNRRESPGSRSRKRRERGNIEHIHLVISLIAGSHGVPAAFAQEFGRPLWGSPSQLFDSAGHRARTLFEHRSACVAEIGLVLPQAVFDPGGVRNVASAEPEGVGRTRGPLLGSATIVLRKGTCCAKESCCHCDRKTVGVRNHIGSLTLIGVASGSHPRTAALRKKSEL